jgi:hypothetical protein
VLKTDRRYLESIARKDFGLVRPNEIIYQFPIRSDNINKSRNTDDNASNDRNRNELQNQEQQ